MKKLTFITFTILMLLLSTVTLAQVSTTVFEKNNEVFNIHSILKTDIHDVSVKKMRTVNTEQLLAEDEQLKGMDIPFRFGEGIDVNYTLDDGIWIKNATSRVWSLKIISTGAYSLNFIFEKLYLPEEAEQWCMDRLQQNKI